jgi:predicted RNA-binding protein with PUA-like domain
MQPGDAVLFYHSGEGREIVGLAKVAKAAYPDPTATEGDWSAVDLKPVKALARPVGLATIKSDPALKDLALLRQSRLSVTPLTEPEYRRLLELGGVK